MALLVSDSLQKRVEYEQVGVQELWIIDQPKQKLTVLDLGEDGQFVEREIDGPTLTASTVNGFCLEIDWLWCEPQQFPSTLSIVQGLLQRQGNA